MDLWKKAARRLAFDRGLSLFGSLLTFIPAHLLLGAAVVALATWDVLGMWGLLVGIALSVSYLWMWAELTRSGALDFEGSLGRVPRRKEVSANNPQVLKIVLWYLDVTVFREQEHFAETVKEKVRRLNREYDTYSPQRSVLESYLRDTERDAQYQTIDQSALLRINSLLRMIEERQEILRSQIDQSEKIIKPIAVQAEALRQHLYRLNRDQRIADSLKALGVIDRAIPADDQFLSSLAQGVERSKAGLAELLCEAKAVQAAWGEVRLESVLEPEDELRLNA